MGLESATYLQDLDASNPAGTDQKAQGDDHIRLMKAVLKATFPSSDKPFYFPTFEEITGNETVAAADENNWYFADTSGGSIAVTLPTGLGTSKKGFRVYVQRGASESNNLTVAAASGNINGVASISIAKAYEVVCFHWTGTAWYSDKRGALSMLDTIATAQLDAEAVTLDKIQDIADDRLLGNNSGGSATAIELTPAEATAMLNPMTGDSGAGGVQGLVPAPAIGDAVKALLGDGDFHLAEDIDTEKSFGTTQKYAIMPGGMILQGGSATASSGNATITFQKAFPNAVFSVVVTDAGNDPGGGVDNNNAQIRDSSVSTTGFEVSCSGKIYWQAMGY